MEDIVNKQNDEYVQRGSPLEDALRYKTSYLTCLGIMLIPLLTSLSTLRIEMLGF